MLGALIGLLIFIADIWAIINIINSSEKGSTKIIWVIVILLLPVIGLLIWLLAGPQSRVRT
jgi:hypothetical protein